MMDTIIWRFLLWRKQNESGEEAKQLLMKARKKIVFSISYHI
jgi:hypothetical protein